MSLPICNTLTACPIQEQTLRMLTADTNKAFLVATNPDFINSRSSEDLLKSIGLYDSSRTTPKEDAQKLPTETPRGVLANRAYYADYPGEHTQINMETTFKERCNRILGKKTCDDFNIDETHNQNTSNHQIQRHKSLS